VRRAALALLLCLLAPAPAWAETSEDQPRARELFAQGVAAAQRSDYAAAVEAFERSYELYSHPGTLINLAQYQDVLGQRAAAYRSWRELLERFDTVITARSLRQARERVAALEPELAAVWVTITPSGASVQVDGGEVWPTPMNEPIRLAPGRHEFVGRREGYQDTTVARELQAGVNPDVTLTLAPVRAEPSPSILIVESATERASVSIDGGPLRPAPVRVALDPGEHEVRVVALGHVEETRQVAVAPEQETRASFELEVEPEVERPVAEPVVVPEPVVRRQQDPVRERRRERGFWHGPWPWVIGGVLVTGAAALGLGLGLAPGGAEDLPAADAVLRFR
jgi:hypothetical protein